MRKCQRQVVKGEEVSVNEADNLCWNLLVAGPRVRRQVCGVSVVV